MPESIRVMTPAGSGIVFGIDRDHVVVEFDYQYLVNLRLDQVERIDEK